MWVLLFLARLINASVYKQTNIGILLNRHALSIVQQYLLPQVPLM
jgi:hypothetical protein